MKRFIKGTFELDKDVTDLEAYEEKNKRRTQAVQTFCDALDIAFVMGTADDNTYLIEYKIVGNTKSYCRGVLREMKDLLKRYFPYVKSLWEASGDQLW